MLLIIPTILAYSFITSDGYSCKDRLNGYYEDRQIYICPQLTKEEKKFTYFHEYGHYMWFTLPLLKQLEWQSFDNLDDINSYISNYACFSPLEDFAETFTYIVLKKDNITDNELLTKKKRFIRLIIYSLIK